MANKKINQLVSKTAILSTDLFGIGDATTGQLYKKTIAELQAAIGGAVISVNGLVGTVVLDTDDIQELATPTNKYFTDARARGAISLTVTGNSGASTYSSGTGVLNVPTYTLAGLGGITASFLSGTSGISYNSTTGVISYSGTVYTDASIRALLSGGTGITYNNSTGAISYSGTVYTDSSVRALISLTTTGTSGASTYNNITGVINVPNYTLAGLGGISLTSLSGGTGITYNNTTGAISYSGTVYTDASVRALISATGNISYNSTTGVISTSLTQYTDALARASVSLTTTGTSGVSTYNSTTGVFNIPQYASAFSGTTNYHAKFTSSTTIGNSLIFDNGTNIGIGTTSPQTALDIINSATYQLHIADTTSNYSNGRIYFGGLGTGDPFYYGTIGYNQSDITMRIGVQCGNATGGITFYTSSNSSAQTEKMRINSVGDVAIGSNSPQNFSGYTTLTVNNNTNGGVVNTQLNGVNGVRIGSAGGNGFISEARNLPLVFEVNASERLRITATGNVGIATSSPTGKFSVNTGASNQIAFFNNSTSGGTYNIISLNGAYSEGTNMSIQGGDSGDANLYVNSGYTSSTSGAIIFRSGGASSYTERMRITSSGNVGIGTTSISTGYSGGTGSITIQNARALAFNNASDTFTSTTAGGGITYFTDNNLYIDAKDSSSNMIFRVNGATERMRITTSGNLAIGSQSDSGYKLYVSGTIYATGNITANSDLTLKKNLKLIDNPIDKLMQLNGYAYQWKSDDSHQYGVIAQEVEKILPYAVSTGNDGIKGVSYNQIIPVLIEAVKEQKAKIENLEILLASK